MFQDYDFVAPFYPLLEKAAFGDALNEARCAFLAPVINAPSALLIGEGNGRFLAACLQNKTGGSITVIDASRRMLSLLRSRIQRINYSTKLELVLADFRCWPHAGPAFDVIVTHFFLDLFRPDSQRRVLAKIAALSKPETVWVNVDFRPGLQSTLYRSIEWMQYRFDRLFSGVEAERHYDPVSLVKQFGWVAVEERLFCDERVVAQLLTRNGHGAGQKSSTRDQCLLSIRNTVMTRPEESENQ